MLKQLGECGICQCNINVPESEVILSHYSHLCVPSSVGSRSGFIPAFSSTSPSFIEICTCNMGYTTIW